MRSARVNISLPQRPKRKRNQKQGAMASTRAPPVPSRNSASYKLARSRIRAPPKRQSRQRGARGQMRGNPMLRPFPEGNRSRTFRTCVVENDEYIGEVLGCNSTTVPVIQTFPVNPGQVATFPWLSEQAAQWEKYRFEYLSFYYKPEVSGFATEGQSGKVIMTMDYDASDPAPTTKQEMEDTDPHVDGMPYEDITLALDPYDMFTDSDAKFVRIAGLPGGSDIKTYDAGNVTVMTLNNGGTNAVGELHVRYKVSFRVPVLEATKSAAPANNQVTDLADNTEIVYTSTVQKLAPLATSLANGLVAVNTAGSILLPAGNYLVDWRFIGTDSSAETFTVIASLENLTSSAVIDTSQEGPVLVGATGRLQVSGTAFVALNGSTAIGLEVTLTGAAGTLQGQATMRIVAV